MTSGHHTHRETTCTERSIAFEAPAAPLENYRASMALILSLKLHVSRVIPGLLTQGSRLAFAGVASSTRAFASAAAAAADSPDLPADDEDAEFEPEPEIQEVERLPDGE